MTLGMIVRADFGRGLANQTHSFYKHLKPDVTVLVDISLIASKTRWPQNFDAYPDAIRTQWKGYTAPFENPVAYEALRDCDIIYTAETHYDERLQNHPSILHVNPEFFRGQKASQYWYPTTWRTDDMPPGHIVPTPVADEEIATEIPGPGKFLHVGGHIAIGDRNGSRIVHGMLGKARHPWRVTSQDGMRINPRLLAYVEVMGYVEDRWSLYEDCAALVYPRRYGGQSLQVNEAMARGLAVIMPDCEPNLATWPIVPVPVRPGSQVKTPGGMIRTHQADMGQLIDTVNALAEPELMEKWQTRSLLWARDNAWSVWKPKIEALIAAS